MNFSKQESTVSSFLLRANVGNDNKCVAASGPWPAGAVSGGLDDDVPNTNYSAPYVTCFTFQGGEDHCWSHSYYESGDWKPCTPKGFGAAGWSIDSPSDDDWPMGKIPQPNETCGTACTEFSKDLST